MNQEKMIDAYRGQYGDETDRLFEALRSPKAKIALINPFLSDDDLAPITSSGVKESLLGCDFYHLPPSLSPRMINGLLSHYFMDLSSLLPPLLLPIDKGERVLDMCSAPGGKLLVMLSRKIEGAIFTANDLSPARINRLKKVLNDFLPEKLKRDRVTVSNRQGTDFGLRRPQTFDAVLLDAPCSSEAHVFNDLKLLNRFSGIRKHLPYRQYSLLCAALLALKPGGHVIYATCSINKQENEGVIAKLLRKKSDQCSLVEISSPIGVRSEFGINILPHISSAGPLFFSMIKKRD